MSIIDDLLLLPDDAIDYKALAADVLLELATQDSEPYLATSALGELSGRGGGGARTAALAILANEPWDRHLSAFAIGVLCRIDCGQATEVMRRLLGQTSDPKILGAMIECVLSEPDHFSSEAGGPFAWELATKVEALDADEFADVDERAAFLARYHRS
jgi:hypothetical protein